MQSDDEIPDLSLKDSTIDSLAKVLIAGESGFVDSIWGQFTKENYSERSDEISEFLRSRKLGFFDENKYPKNIEKFYRKEDGSIAFNAIGSVGIKNAFTFTGFKD